MAYLVAMVLASLLVTGCFTVPDYEVRRVNLQPGDTLRLELTVASGEVVEGSWSGDGISGTYVSPSGNRRQWRGVGEKHDFEVNGVATPGTYVFEFQNQEDGVGTLLFRYRTKVAPPAAAGQAGR